MNETAQERVLAAIQRATKDIGRPPDAVKVSDFMLLCWIDELGLSHEATHTVGNTMVLSDPDLERDDILCGWALDDDPFPLN